LYAVLSNEISRITINKEKTATLIIENDMYKFSIKNSKCVKPPKYLNALIQRQTYTSGKTVTINMKKNSNIRYINVIPHCDAIDKNIKI
ncbi:hypothetical protein QN379_21935, partial [Glaciimonas sp. Gout2]|uniref:hypothetical protein n=1 Tax=Glaciimonas sp. Gout2 TaxID=3048625 RepID=UPI002B22D325